MKNKIIGIVLCMLITAMIPIAAGVTVHQQSQTSQIGWTTLQGFIYGLEELNGGAEIQFKCFFVHYIAQGVSQRVTGFRYGGQLMAIPGTFKGVLLPHMILGYCPGVLEF